MSVSILSDMSCVKETYVICKRDLCRMQKRPLSYAKETYDIYGRGIRHV